MSKTSTATRRGAAVAATGLTTVAVTGISSANLVGKLGWDNDAALALVALLATGGAPAVIAIFPLLAPVMTTLQLALLFGGAGAVVGF